MKKKINVEITDEKALKEAEKLILIGKKIPAPFHILKSNGHHVTWRCSICRKQVTLNAEMDKPKVCPGCLKI